MNDRLEIASRVLAKLVHDTRYFTFQERAEDALAYADELIKQEALTRVKKEAEEHK